LRHCNRVEIKKNSLFYFLTCRISPISRLL
jgi:hypothetical protein